MNRKSIGYLLTGAGVGMLAGFLGIGGGVILVPTMVWFFSFSQHNAHGTSLAIIPPVALIGAVLYALRGDMDWVLVATIGSGSMVGVIGGAKLMMRMPAQRLQQVFGAFVIIVAVLLLLK